MRNGTPKQVHELSELGPLECSGGLLSTSRGSQEIQGAPWWALDAVTLSRAFNSVRLAPNKDGIAGGKCQNGKIALPHA